MYQSKGLASAAALLIAVASIVGAGPNSAVLHFLPDTPELRAALTRYHDALAVRRLFKLKPAPEFLAWLQGMGIYRDAEPALLDASARRQLLQGLESSLGKTV